jgi:lysyl-tRNA synthetase, class I
MSLHQLLNNDQDWNSVKAWPFQEAKKVVKRIESSQKDHVLFETGYGPSGLPHIGTFGEVARTTMVRNAFQRLSGIPSKILAFSDDMDGLRKVPDNVPNRDMLAQYIGRPLTSIPDPFGTHASFGEHNNACLQEFLDRFGFEYEFASSTDYYRSGRFNSALLRILERYDEVINVILPTLGEDRKSTYSPFLPICPRTGIVMQVPIIQRNIDAGTIVWQDIDTGKFVETPVTNGYCKLQWKCDWAMRWFALGVDYEMSGKDLIDSVKLSSKICRILGAEPPVNFTYELFLDEHGQKISKSKGNGLTIDEWLTYGPPESLSQFMYNQPTVAKKLHTGIVPRAIDEYLQNVDRIRNATELESANNPAWHIHNGDVPGNIHSPVTFQTLLNIAKVSSASNELDMWRFVRNYVPDAEPETFPFLAVLINRVIAYTKNVVNSNKNTKEFTMSELTTLHDFCNQLNDTDNNGLSVEQITAIISVVGNIHFTQDGCQYLNDLLYRVVLGQSTGPDISKFIVLYGINNFINVMKRKINNNV